MKKLKTHLSLLSKYLLRASCLCCKRIALHVLLEVPFAVDFTDDTDNNETNDKSVSASRTYIFDFTVFNVGTARRGYLIKILVRSAEPLGRGGKGTDLRAIVVTNEKGGIGKTTTTVNLAAALAELGRRVLVVDLDYQAASTQWLGFTDIHNTLLLDVLKQDGSLVDVVWQTEVAGVELVPASVALKTSDKELGKEIGAELLIEDQLKRLPPDRWDYVIFDCNPNLGVLSVGALAAAHEVLIPVQVTTLAVQGLVLFMDTVRKVQTRLNRGLTVLGFLPCMVTHTSHARAVVKDLREKFGEKVFQTEVHSTVRLQEAPSYAQPITTYNSKSSAAAEYRALAREVEERAPGREAPAVTAGDARGEEVTHGGR